MPADLLDYVSGPTPYSSWWSWVAVLSGVFLVLGCAAIFGFTQPARRWRGLPLVGPARDAMIKRRFARAVHDIGERHRSGRLGAAGAGAAVGQQLRAFLHHATGRPTQFMQVHQLSDGDLAPAGEVLALLEDAQFNPASRVDVGAVTDSCEELIRSWT